MKFTIRDLFLVTVIVAVCMAWWLDRGKLTDKVDKLENKVDALLRETMVPRKPTQEDLIRAMRGRDYKKMADESREKYGVP